MKKILALALVSLLTLSGCTQNTSIEETPDTSPNSDVVEQFAVQYEMKGTTSRGEPKNDTFIFEGTTTDGIITDLVFDVIRNKGLEGEYSKTDIMGYYMNVSDATVEKIDDDFKITLTSNGYDENYIDGQAAQYMVVATHESITDTTTFKDLTFSSFGSTPENFMGVELEQALIAYKGLAAEAGITELTQDTLVFELLSAHGLYADSTFVEGKNRVSFDGINGGRSFGEQIDAISAHILASNMTLEQVYEMFKTVNQHSEPIMERDTVSGATIAFVGDFSRMVYLAINGEIFEGVTTHTTTDGNTKVEVVTQGYGGEIETHVTFDADAKIVSIEIRDANETPDIGSVLTKADSKFINSLIDTQSDLENLDVVSGATITSNALINAVKFAIEYNSGL